MSTTDTYKHVSSERDNLPTQQTEHMMTDQDKTPTVFTPTVRERDDAPVLAWARKLGSDQNIQRGG